MAAEPHRRPSARGLAAALGGTGRPTPRWLALAAAGGALVVGGLALVVTADGSAPATDDLEDWVATIPAPTTARTASSLTTTTSVGPPSTLASTAPAGSAPGPTVIGPNLVAMGAERYEAGAPGDQVVLGDWDCDGESTVALLRAATGEVFVFDEWPAAGQDRTNPPVTMVPGAIRAEAADGNGDGCHDLVVERAAGQLVEVGR
jgi:hypothetical protein